MVGPRGREKKTAATQSPSHWAWVISPWVPGLGSPKSRAKPARDPSRAAPGRSNGQCVRYSNLPGGGTPKQASRVRETHTFNTLHFPASVSSTRDAHFQNQVSSRLCEALLFLKNCSLVYAKPLLLEATLSRVHPSPALLSQLEHGKSRVSCTRNACLQNVP